MIRSKDALIACVSAGETIARMAVFEGRGFRWCVTSTGETVSKAAIARAVKAEKLSLVSSDLVGEPAQYGAA